MIRLLVFLATLVFSVFIILYSDLTWQLTLVYGKHKLIVNFWFAILVTLLLYLTVHWLIRQILYAVSLPKQLRKYCWNRKIRGKQYAKGQAMMYALTEDYQTACAYLPLEEGLLLSDLVLLATWLNKLQDIQKLDEVLAKIQSLNQIPDGWMVWFRAYLLYDRGKQQLATDVLLDAIESGAYTDQIVHSFVKFADPEKHYVALSTHYNLLSRHVYEKDLLPKIIEGASIYMDTLIANKQWEALRKVLYDLPKKVRKDDRISYYHLKLLMIEGREERLLSFLKTVHFKDSRLIPLIADMEIALDKKIAIITEALDKETYNQNLLYLLSYLQAQSGDMFDTVKTLESAIRHSE